MAFQFLCPQGHLLQADASQMGRTINCPTCGVLFVVPTVTTAAAVQPVIQVPPMAPPAAPEPAESAESEDDDPLDLNLRGRRGRRRAHLDIGLPDAGEVAEHEVVEAGIPEPAVGSHSTLGGLDSGPRLVHLHCPQGHELITPFETMGQDVLCPHCGEQFLLRYPDTVEYKTKHQLKEEIREQKLGQKWLTWAIVAGVLVLAMFIGMMLHSMR
ncbi:MAG: hypothetical protein K8T91_06140 [Planctomycetes bacterium]|nr:hypothetical protein [Planctomycetota bacterium]